MHSLLNDSFLIKKIDYIILFFITLLIISLSFAPTSVIGVLSGLSFVVFFIKRIVKKEEKLVFNSFDQPVLYYVIIVGLSLAFSRYFWPSLKGYLKVLTYLALYLTFINVLAESNKRAYYLLGVIAITGFAEAILAIIQSFQGIEALATWQDTSRLNPEQIMTRVYGTLQPPNPNLLGGYLLACVSSAAGMFFIYAKKKKAMKSALFLAAWIFITFGIVLTGSRGSYIGLAAVISGIIMSSGHIIWRDLKEKTKLKRIWIYIVFSGLAILALAVIASPAIQQRLLSMFEFHADSSNSFRLNVFASSFKMFLDNWTIGIGPGNETFRLVYGQYMKAGYDALAAYSIPLEIAVEGGILALLAFVWLIINSLVISIKAVLSKNKINTKIMFLTCIIGIIGLLGHGLVDTIFFRPQVHIIFWLYIAIIRVNFSKYSIS